MATKKKLEIFTGRGAWCADFQDNIAYQHSMFKLGIERILET